MKERITARIVVYNEENNILLFKIRDDNATSWLLPGGKIEKNETALEAARRELFEETGIKNALFKHQTPQWYCQDIVTINKEQIVFKEYVFLAFSREKLIVYENKNEEVLGHDWCNIFELFSKKEMVYPRGLIEKLALTKFY